MKRFVFECYIPSCGTDEKPCRVIVEDKKCILPTSCPFGFKDQEWELIEEKEIEVKE